MISETEHGRKSSHDFYITISCDTFFSDNVRTQNLTLQKKLTERAVLDRQQRCVKWPFIRTIEFSGHQDRLPSCDVFYKWK